MKTITQSEIDLLVKTGHCVFVYKRKKIVCVDGHKYYILKGGN